MPLLSLRTSDSTSEIMRPSSLLSLQVVADSQMGAGGMLEQPTGLLVHGFGSTTPRLVGARLRINDHQPHARTDCVDDTKLRIYDPTPREKVRDPQRGAAPPLKLYTRKN